MIIDQLPAALTVDPTDELPIEKGQVTYKATASQLTGNKVSKSGDTMTGNLKISLSDPFLNIENPNADYTTSPSSNQFIRIIHRDKNDKVLALWQTIHKAANQTETTIGVRNKLSGSEVSNTLTLQVNNDGSRTVALSDAAPWRSAIGLGTSGVLPITIAQGGTGQTGVTIISSNIATASNGFSITDANFAQFGKVAQLRVKLKRTGASVTTNTELSLASLVTGKKNIAVAVAGVIVDPTIVYSYINGSGTISCNGTWAQNAEKVFLATYILAN